MEILFIKQSKNDWKDIESLNNNLKNMNINFFFVIFAFHIIYCYLLSIIFSTLTAKSKLFILKLIVYFSKI